MTLTEFLLARIAEDEAVSAAACIPAHDGYKAHGVLDRWRYEGEEVEVDYDEPGPYASKFLVTADHEGLVPAVEEPEGRHIARHDPARVLAECQAKRRIVDLHFDAYGEEKAAGDPDDVALLPSYCACCNDGEDYWKEGAWPCSTLRLLALPYADHPDYDSAWATSAPE